MITSTQNAQVKHVVNLINKGKYRRENKQFVVEGTKMVFEAPKEELEKVYVSETYLNEHKKDIESIDLGEDRLIPVLDNVFKQMSDTKTPQGILGIVKMKSYSLQEVIGGDNAFVIVCEDIQDPGNMGTILRTAEGAGVTGIVMTNNTVDIYNPKTIRSTMGSVYRVPFIYTDNLADVMAKMKLLDIKMYAAHLNGNNSYTANNYCSKCAFLIGNEGNGLKQETADKCDCLIRIPMEGKVESLNAAISSAVLMYEVNRQRGI